MIGGLGKWSGLRYTIDLEDLYGRDLEVALETINKLHDLDSLAMEAATGNPGSGRRISVGAVKDRCLREIAEVVAANARKLVNLQGSRTLRSLPGQPPRVQTGRGRRSIRGMGPWVGSDGSAWYMGLLDRGTRRIRPRPWLDPAFQMSMPLINRIIDNTLDSVV